MSGSEKPADVLAREKRKADREKLELHLARDLKVAKLTEGMVREHRFHPPRRWRFDFAWPEIYLAVEVEGITYEGGRHQRVQGYEDDCEKYNRAQMLGWRVLRYTGGMVERGEAWQEIRAVIQIAKFERGMRDA